MKEVLNVLASIAQTVAYGEKAIEPNNPLKEGYEFKGWSTNKHVFEKFDFNTAITKDMTLYAFWNEDTRLIKIGIINLSPEESVGRQANVRDLKNTFTMANGYKTYNYNSNEHTEQLAAFNQFIEDGARYILLAATSFSGWDDAINKAKKANIPVVLFDRMIRNNQYTAAVVSNFKKEGEKAVNWLIRQGFPEYNVLHLQGKLQSDAQIDRSNALNKIASLKAIKLSIVKQQTGNWSTDEAKQITKDTISQGIAFNVVYAENDDMAKGAVQALDEAGRSHGVNGDIIILSFDGNKWALEELLKGKWNCIIQWSPFQAAQLHKIIQDLENGIQPAQKIFFTEEGSFDAKTISKNDIEKYGF